MEKLGNKPGIARGLNNLGIIYFKYKKDHQKSIDFLQRAVEIYGELKMPQLEMNTKKSLDFVKKQFEAK